MSQNNEFIYQILKFIDLMDKTDEELSASLNSFKIKNPKRKCVGDNLIKKICTNSACKAYALHCESNECKNCFQNHLLCTSVQMGGLTKILKDQYQDQLSLLSGMAQIENKFISQLHSKRRQFQKTISFNDMDKQFQNFVQHAYFYGNNSFTITGKQGKQIYQAMTGFKDYRDTKIYLQDYEEILKISFNYLNSHKSLIIKNYNSRQMSINSKIIQQCQESYQKDLKVIRQALESPRRLELVFRASQYNFSAAQFHKKCDQIENSFIIVHTEFGKKIAGFTSISWEVKQDDAIDKQPKSFLLQIDSKQKMNLFTGNKPTAQIKGYGPIFGSKYYNNQYDLCITDKCNSNKSSYANFPTVYNHVNNYVNNQQSYTAFSGATDGCNFKILEYEVFKVFWK